jgi:hypothetical protein
VHESVNDAPNKQTLADERDQNRHSCRQKKSVLALVKRLRIEYHDKWQRLTVKIGDPFRLLRVNIPLVIQSLDLFVDDAAVIAPEDIGVHRRRVDAQFSGAAFRPLFRDTARLVLGETTLCDQELHEEIADLAGGCFLVWQVDGGIW